jgi:cobalamin transport system permease protein
LISSKNINNKYSSSLIFPAQNLPQSYSRKTLLIFLIIITSLVFLFVADIITGTVKIPLNLIWDSIVSDHPLKPEWRTILYDFRLPRALVAILAGMALAVSGLEMQTYFRNPLAGPYVLGISSGASLGVAIMVMGLSFINLPAGFSMNQWAIVLAAWIGAGIVMMLILAVSARINDNTTILILGILFGSITMALVSILQYLSTETEVKAFIIWTLGSLGNVTGSQLKVMIPAVVSGLFLSLLSIKSLNAMLLGEQYARSMGVNILLSRLLIFVSTSILAGTITAFCGPIGFIGIAVPHITRMLFSTSDHRIIVPGTLIMGAVLMLISDIISQLPGSGQILPINSVTAIIGVPVVIWIILKKQRVISVS